MILFQALSSPKSLAFSAIVVCSAQLYRSPPLNANGAHHDKTDNAGRQKNTSPELVVLQRGVGRLFTVFPAFLDVWNWRSSHHAMGEVHPEPSLSD